MDFETVTKSSLEPHLNTIFHFLVAADKTVDLTFITVDETDRPPVYSLSLVFKGPKNEILSGGTYHYKHDTFGESSIFLKPFAEDDDSILYDAVISRLTENV